MVVVLVRSGDGGGQYALPAPQTYSGACTPRAAKTCTCVTLNCEHVNSPVKYVVEVVDGRASLASRCIRARAQTLSILRISTKDAIPRIPTTSKSPSSQPAYAHSPPHPPQPPPAPAPAPQPLSLPRPRPNTAATTVFDGSVTRVEPHVLPPSATAAPAAPDVWCLVCS